MIIQIHIESLGIRSDLNHSLTHLFNNRLRLRHLISKSLKCLFSLDFDNGGQRVLLHVFLYFQKSLVVLIQLDLDHIELIITGIHLVIKSSIQLSLHCFEDIFNGLDSLNLEIIQLSSDDDWSLIHIFFKLSDEVSVELDHPELVF